MKSTWMAQKASPKKDVIKKSIDSEAANQVVDGFFMDGCRNHTHKPNKFSLWTKVYGKNEIGSSACTGGELNVYIFYIV